MKTKMADGKKNNLKVPGNNYDQTWKYVYLSLCLKEPGARFTNVLSAKKIVGSFLRTVCVSQTPSTYEFLKDFAKIFLNIVVTLRQGGGDLIFQKIS